MNTTKTSTTKKSDKIPAVKHFYDSQAGKKAKRLAKKAMNSNFVKHARGVTKKSGSKKGLIAGAIAAPIALQIGTVAVVAAGGYALWKNRFKIQELLGNLGGSKDEGSASSMGA